MNAARDRARPEGFFRGSELPRLLVLAVVAVCGWIAMLAGLAREDPRPQGPPRVAAQVPPLPPPDPGEEFQGIQDREFMTPRDNAAYATLLRRVRETPYKTLAAESRREVLWSQLIEDPARYRGLPIHVDGTALRVLIQHVEGSKVFPDGKYYEAYIITPDSVNYPWILAFENAPADLQIGDNIRQRVRFDGYFLKLVGYRRGSGKPLWAPLLVGRFPPAEAGAAGAPPRAPLGAVGRGISWPLIVLIVVTAYLALRIVLQFRSMRRRPVYRSFRSPVSDQIEPDELSAWIEGGGEDGDEDDFDDPPPRGRRR